MRTTKPPKLTCTGLFASVVARSLPIQTVKKHSSQKDTYKAPGSKECTRST